MSGIFRWKVRRGAHKAGTKAGRRQTNGDGTHEYIEIRYEGKAYAAHRLAWWFMTGKWPDFPVDHKNTNSLHNAWDNLRRCATHENNCNRRKPKHGKNPYKGVTPLGKRFRARIFVAGVETHLGVFDTPEDAYAAYKEAAERIHGSFMHAA